MSFSKTAFGTKLYLIHFQPTSTSQTLFKLIGQLILIHLPFFKLKSSQNLISMADSTHRNLEI